MRSALIMILGVLVIISCENSEEPNPEANEPADYFPLYTGSYWVYDTYIIDSVGIETLKSSNDTMRVTGDTFFESEHYKIVLGKRLGHDSGPPIERYYRDSAGFILDIDHRIVFPEIAFRDSFGLETTPASWGGNLYYQWYYNLESYPEGVSLSSGAFDSLLNRKLTVMKSDTIDEIIGTFNSLYAPNIGRILYQYAYVGGYEHNGSYFEGRLVDYFIPPRE